MATKTIRIGNKRCELNGIVSEIKNETVKKHGKNLYTITESPVKKTKTTYEYDVFNNLVRATTTIIGDNENKKVVKIRPDAEPKVVNEMEYDLKNRITQMVIRSEGDGSSGIQDTKETWKYDVKSKEYGKINIHIKEDANKRVSETFHCGDDKPFNISIKENNTNTFNYNILVYEGGAKAVERITSQIEDIVNNYELSPIGYILKTTEVNQHIEENIIEQHISYEWETTDSGCVRLVSNTTITEMGKTKSTVKKLYKYSDSKAEFPMEMSLIENDKLVTSTKFARVYTSFGAFIQFGGYLMEMGSAYETIFEDLILNMKDNKEKRVARTDGKNIEIRQKNFSYVSNNNGIEISYENNRSSYNVFTKRFFAQDGSVMVITTIEVKRKDRYKPVTETYTIKVVDDSVDNFVETLLEASGYNRFVDFVLGGYRKPKEPRHEDDASCVISRGE